FFFTDPAPSALYTLSLHDALPICKQSRHVPLKNLLASLNLKLRGYYNYYGVSGNSDRVREFFNEAMGTLWKWLNRRSQRRSFTRSEEHTSELQSRSDLVCRLLLEK